MKGVTEIGIVIRINLSKEHEGFFEATTTWEGQFLTTIARTEARAVKFMLETIADGLAMVITPEPTPVKPEVPVYDRFKIGDQVRLGRQLNPKWWDKIGVITGVDATYLGPSTWHVQLTASCEGASLLVFPGEVTKL